MNGAATTNAKGRLAEAYTDSPNPTDLGFSYSARGEVTDVYQSSPHSSGYYRVSAAYWANGLVNTLSVLNNLNAPVAGLPNWTYTPDGEGRIATMSVSGVSVATLPTAGYNLFGLPTGVNFASGDSDTFIGNSTRLTPEVEHVSPTSPTSHEQD